jgi:hypothetical protein
MARLQPHKILTHPAADCKEAAQIGHGQPEFRSWEIELPRMPGTNWNRLRIATPHPSSI